MEAQICRTVKLGFLPLRMPSPVNNAEASGCNDVFTHLHFAARAQFQFPSAQPGEAVKKKKKNTLTNRLKCQGVPLGWSANDAMRSWIQTGCKLFLQLFKQVTGRARNVLDMPEEKLCGSFANQSDFCRKVDGFLCESLGKLPGSAPVLELFDAESGGLMRSFQWLLVVCILSVFSASGVDGNSKCLTMAPEST